MIVDVTTTAVPVVVFRQLNAGVGEDQGAFLLAIAAAVGFVTVFASGMPRMLMQLTFRAAVNVLAVVVVFLRDEGRAGC